MTEYVVINPFTWGEWTYRPGEEFTADELAQRGLDGADLERAIFRNGISKAEAAAPVPTDPSPVPAPDGD